VALLIANGTFDHPKVEPLRGPVDDARRLEEILSGLGEFTTEVIADATDAQVQSKVVDTLGNGHPDDVILLHFAGHGTQDRRRDEPYLVTRDTADDQLFNTAVPVSLVLEQVCDSPARTVVLILNCCFGAAINLPGTTAAEAFGSLGRRGGVRLVIASTNRTGRAYERAGPGPGSGSLFTAALLEGVASPDTRPDDNGWISLQTLFDYAHGMLSATTAIVAARDATMTAATTRLICWCRSTAWGRPAPEPPEPPEPRNPRSKLLAGSRFRRGFPPVRGFRQAPVRGRWAGRGRGRRAHRSRARPSFRSLVVPGSSGGQSAAGDARDRTDIAGPA
jgi:hypothetical protein